MNSVFSKVIMMSVLKVIPGVLNRGNLNTRIISCFKRPFSNCFEVSNEVSAAVSSRKPVVALESTIITHGTPHPTNINTALEVENLIRDLGVTPATIGVVDGVLKVGLSGEEMNQLATGGASVIKTARRDLPYVLSQNLCGGTTVSATMFAAHKAGIRIFATGGIGGVHRGGESSMDISSDLMELGSTPVAVVSSGAKSILDIQRTLEFLETQGVCVTTLGETRDFPAFYTSKSGLFSPHQLETVEQVAELIRCSIAQRLNKGLLIAVPIPHQYSHDGAEIEAATILALQEASDKGIGGKELTPFLLSRVAEITGGSALTANVALIKNNAEIAARIAKALAAIYQSETKSDMSSSEDSAKKRLERSHETSSRISFMDQTTGLDCENTPEKSFISLKRPVVIGASNIDLTSQITDSKIIYGGGATNSGRMLQTAGGVARNIADCLSRIGINTLFISAVGRDDFGDMLFTSCTHMDTSGIDRLSNHHTATYNLVLSSHGDVVIGVGEMDIHKCIGKDQISGYDDEIQSAALVAVDGNIPTSTLEFLIDLAHSYEVPVWYEPTDLHKAAKPFRNESWKKISYLSPNIAELRIIYHAIMTNQPDVDIPDSVVNAGSMTLKDVIDECKLMCKPILEHTQCVAITLGDNGVLVAYKSSGNSNAEFVHYPAPLPVDESHNIVSVSGAGDCFAAGMMSGIIKGYSVDLCVRSGLLAAHKSLQSHQAVAPEISHTPFTVKHLKTLPWNANKLS